MPAQNSSVLTIANGLSAARLTLVLSGSLSYLYGHQYVGIALGAAAGVTDLLDGPLARKLNQVTELGAVLDRVGDLFFESALFLIFCRVGLVHPVLALLYFLREFLVGGIRELAASRKIAIHSSIFGKAKTHAVAYGMLCFGLFDAKILEWPGLLNLGTIGIVIALGLSYISAWQYSKQLVLKSGL